MEREKLVQFLSRTIRHLGKREFKISFDQLDDMSLIELTNFIRSLAQTIEDTDGRSEHIGNRCKFLAIERNSGDQGIESNHLCRADFFFGHECPYLHDDQAQKFCPAYSREP